MNDFQLTETHIWHECPTHGVAMFFEDKRGENFVCGHPSICDSSVPMSVVTATGIPINHKHGAGVERQRVAIDEDLFGVEHIKRIEKGKYR